MIEIWQTSRGKRRLINTVRSTSRFKNTNVEVIRQKVAPDAPKNEALRDPRVQRGVAEDIVQGWRRNGPDPHATYEVIEK